MWKYAVPIPLLFLLLLPVPGHAQGASLPVSAAGESLRRTLSAVPVSGATPVIDGRLDEAVWQSAEVAADFVQLRPHAGAAASERTEARVLYDDRALYVGIRLHDSRPDSIVAQLARRDQNVYADWVYVGIDSYHDRRTAFLFGVNPAGVKRDLMLYDDTREDEGWDAVWEAAVRTDSLGWTAELRIPLSQLRFAGGEQEKLWGINFRRYIARRDELSYWSPVPGDGAGLVSYFGELRGIRGVRPPRRLEILPYSVGRLTRAPGDAADPFHAPNDLYGSVGADVRYGLTSNFTLSATLNPDFGQVEADPAVVNLSAFETFLEERRPFFLEGTEIFQSGSPRLFHSRRIGRAPRGAPPADALHAEVPEASRVLGAVKLTGKSASGWSVGLLNAVTGAAEAAYLDPQGLTRRATVEPLTNYSVGRVIRDFRRGRSAVGATFTATQRRLEEGLEFLPSAAYAGGVDARHRFGGGNYQLSGSLHGSHVQGAEPAIGRLQRAAGRYYQRPDAEHLEYDATRTSLSGYAASARLAKVGGGHWRANLSGMLFSPGFEVNDLGFHLSTDQVRLFAGAQYDQFRPGPLFRRWELSGFLFSDWSFGGERRSTVADLTGSFQLLNHWGVTAWVQRELSALSTDALRGGPALTTPASTRFYLQLHSDRRRPLSLRATLFRQDEEETGGRQLSLGSALTLRASARAELSLGPRVSWNTNAWQWVGRRQLADSTHYLFGRLEQATTALTARLNYTFSANLSLQLHAQPFLSAGGYSDFRDVSDPRAARFAQRFRTFRPGEITEEWTEAGTRRYRVDVTGDGAPDLAFADPSFNVREFRSNAVLRWEYRPGSTLFLVWSQGRSESDGDGSFAVRRDAGRLLRAEPTNVLLVKLSYWLGM